MLSSCRTKLVEQFVEVGVKAAVATVVVDQIADNISSEEFDHLFTLMRVGNDEITNQYLSYLQDKYVPTHTGGEQLDGRDSLLTHTGGNQQLESSGAQTHTGNNQPEGQGVAHTGDTDGTTPAIENTTTTPIPDGQTKDDLMYLSSNSQEDQTDAQNSEPLTEDSGSSVVQNEASDHSGVDGSEDVAKGAIQLSAKNSTKLGQQIGRWKREMGGQGGAKEFLDHASNLATEARKGGSFVTGEVGKGAGALGKATIYHRGNEFLVEQGGQIMSYVANPGPGGVVDEYVRLGGKL